MPNEEGKGPDIGKLEADAWQHLRDAKQKRSVLSVLAELSRAERIENGFSTRIRLRLEGH